MKVFLYQCPWGASEYIWKAKSYPIVTIIAAAIGYLSFKNLDTKLNYFYIERD